MNKWTDSYFGHFPVNMEPLIVTIHADKSAPAHIDSAAFD